MHRETLYDSIHQQRELDRKVYQRVFLSGYFNEQEVKRDNLNPQHFLVDSLQQHPQVSSYVYLKGVFYVQMLESQHIAHINRYLKQFQKTLGEKVGLMNVVRVVHQSYENTRPLLVKVTCDNNPQPGPILGQTQKTDEQITDRAFQIYTLFLDGAKMKADNPSHKIGNMIVLSNDDMAILSCQKFMSLAEYTKLYCEEMEVVREQEKNYPLPPGFFEVMEFLEVENYENFMKCGR